MYSVTLNALYRMLRDYSYSGWGYATLPTGIGHITDPCRVILSIYQGEIKTCYISGSDGQIHFTGKEALDLITQANVLHWTLKAYEDPETPAPSHPAIKPDPTTRPLPALRFLPSPQSIEKYPPGEPRVTRQLPAIRPPRVPRPHPVRVREFPFSEVSLWPRKWRQIYMLANGTTSLDKITSMLQLAPQEMRRIVQSMIAQGIITIRQSE